MAPGSVTVTGLPKGVRLPQAPPPGFDPRTADDATLKAHGLPPRPNKDKQPQKFAKWEKIMSGLKRFVVPDFESTGSCDITSSKWTGAVTTKLDAGESFDDVEGTWIVPCPYPPQCVSGTYDCNSWIGLDGYGTSTDLLRAGTLQRVVANDSGEAISRTVFAWYQWYPEDRFKITSFPVNFGDTIDCEIWALSETEACVFFFNEGSGDWAGFYVEAPDGTTLKGNSAEWIMEDPSLTESAYSMANFASTYFNGCLATTTNGTEEDLSSAQLIVMVKSGEITASAVIENPRLLGIFYRDGAVWA